MRGNATGSAFCFKKDETRTLFLTNAHVWGTRAGSMGQIQWVNDDGTVQSVNATLVAAGYVPNRSIDWAIVAASPNVFPFDPLRLAAGCLGNGMLTIGSPGGRLPLVRRLGEHDSRGRIGHATPPAEPGQSGSPTIKGKTATGMITWTNGRHSMYQTTESLAESMRPEYFETANPGDELPFNAEQASIGSNPAEFGYHGEVANWIEGYAEPTEANWDWIAELVRILVPIIADWLKRRENTDPENENNHC